MMKYTNLWNSGRTVNFASDDNKLKIYIENWCKRNNKELIFSESNSLDIIVLCADVVIADPNYVGVNNLSDFKEFQRDILFTKLDYEDKKRYEFFKEYVDVDENGIFIMDSTELIMANELTPDLVISRLDYLKKNVFGRHTLV